jgi:hypothetical protein
MSNVTKALQILACVLAVGFVVLLGYVLWLTGRSTGILEGASTAPTHSLSAAQTLSSADLQKEIDSAAHDALQREETLLDKLLLLVGVYTTILSILALSTVVVSRQDAREQLEKVRIDTKTLADDSKAKIEGLRNEAKEQLEKIRTDTRALAEENEKKIEALRTEAEADFKKLNEQVQREFPIISQLQQKLLSLIFQLEAKYPEAEDPAKKRPSTWKTELQQQDAVIDEQQILAVSVVALDEENLPKLYLALARLYVARFRTGAQTDDDAARAYLYAGRALLREPGNAEAYRMRGVIAMLRYQSADGARKKSAEFAELLATAKADLERCKLIDPGELGAYYNLAIAHDEEGNRPEAIRISEEGIANLATIPRHLQEKYLADVYVNLACYLGDDFREAKESAAQGQLADRIVALCSEASKYIRNNLKSSKALQIFRDAMRRELAVKGDFRGLPEAVRMELQKLADAAQLAGASEG